MSGPSNERCEDCYFAQYDESQKQGTKIPLICRAHPKTPMLIPVEQMAMNPRTHQMQKVQGMQLTGIQLNVELDHWCGEFVNREEELEARAVEQEVEERGFE